MTLCDQTIRPDFAWTNVWKHCSVFNVDGQRALDKGHAVHKSRLVLLPFSEYLWISQMGLQQTWSWQTNGLHVVRETTHAHFNNPSLNRREALRHNSSPFDHAALSLDPKKTKTPAQPHQTTLWQGDNKTLVSLVLLSSFCRKMGVQMWTESCTTWMSGETFQGTVEVQMPCHPDAWEPTLSRKHFSLKTCLWLKLWELFKYQTKHFLSQKVYVPYKSVTSVRCSLTISQFNFCGSF